MTLSTFMIVLGTHCYLLGFPLLFGDIQILAWRKKILKDTTLLRVIAGVYAAMAAATLKNQWTVTGDAVGFAVFMAWATLIKSVAVAWWPAAYGNWRLTKWEDRFMKHGGWQTAGGIILVGMGAFFTYLSFALGSL